MQRNVKTCVFSAKTLPTFQKWTFLKCPNLKTFRTFLQEKLTDSMPEVEKSSTEIAIFRGVGF
jgi:hypothetical protein